MSSKQLFSSKNEVYEAIFRHDIEHFSELPEEFLDADMAFQWLKGAGDPVAVHYAKIPQQWRSDEILEFAAGEGVNVLKDISPEQTKRYSVLANLCSIHDYRILLDVHPQFRNDKALIKNVCSRYRSTLAQLVNEIDWFGPAIPDDLFVERCQNDLKFALDVQPHLLRQDIIEYVNLLQPSKVLILRSLGRMDLIAEKIETDGWLDNYPEPLSLEEAIGYLLETRPCFSPEALYMGYVMLYPFEDVVKAMKGNRLAKLLLEMYSAEALKPYMNRDKALKGALLEDAMGL
jgi:hypothetical protein